MEKSILGKIITLFWEPSATFQALKARSHWTDMVIPLVIVIIASLISSAYVIPIAANDYRARIENSDRFTDEQKEAGLDRIEQRAESPMQYITTVVAIGVKWLVITACMLFIGNFIFGGELAFKTLLGVSAYINLIDVINMGIKTPLIISRQSTNVSTSLALFMEESTSFLYRFAANIDLFAIWKIILFSIALGVLLNKRAPKPFYAILVMWLLYTGVAAMIAGLAVI